MKIILATSNRGKVKEIKEFLSNYEVLAYSDLTESFEIEENGDTFKANAIIKAKAIYEKLKEENKLEKNMVILSDDSGIDIEALNGEPSIFSARYAGVNATDKDNLNKVINNLKNLNLKSSNAFYTASIAIIDYSGLIQTTHGWMYGKVIDKAIGDNGFGYDPIFIPNGFDKTLGQLENRIKVGLSHRSRAIENAKYILKSLEK